MSENGWDTQRLGFDKRIFALVSTLVKNACVYGSYWRQPKRWHRSWGTTLTLAVLGLVATGCSQNEEVVSAVAESEELPEGSHRLTGTVVAVNPERETLLVQHDEIPGFMPAMTMEFHVSPGDLKTMREGLPIQAVMFRMSDGFWLERIWPRDPVEEGIVVAAARDLRQDTVTRGASAYREVGEDLPDFALYNQDGRTVQAADFAGKQMVVNFIFTRCPDPEMCPAATMRMQQLQKLARESGVSDLELVSITLDPEYDTPGILRDYADAQSIDTSNFSFLTGPESAIKDLMAQLGVLAFADGPLIRHTISTVLINRDGRIVHRVDGSTWDPQDFLVRMRKDQPGKLAGEQDGRGD